VAPCTAGHALLAAAASQQLACSNPVHALVHAHLALVVNLWTVLALCWGWAVAFKLQLATEQAGATRGRRAGSVTGAGTNSSSRRAARPLTGSGSRFRTMVLCARSGEAGGDTASGTRHSRLPQCIRISGPSHLTGYGTAANLPAQRGAGGAGQGVRDASVWRWPEPTRWSLQVLWRCPPGEVPGFRLPRRPRRGFSTRDEGTLRRESFGRRTLHAPRAAPLSSPLDLRNETWSD